MLAAETLQGLESPAALEFFVRTYADRYVSGKQRGRKLLLLAEKLTGELRHAVASAAAVELRSSLDAPNYRRLCEVQREPESGVWLERVERENRVKRAQLDQNVTKAKSEAAREPIRLALRELGLFFRESGESTGCLKALIQAKDFSSTPAQHLEMALLVMEASLDFDRFEYAQLFANKAEPLLPASPKPSNEALKIRVALGLSELNRSRYKSAAKHLLGVSAELKFAEVVSPEDVATYAALCALATFTRRELKETVLDNPGFKTMLELVPVVKNLLQDFYNSRYGSVMKTLDRAVYVLSLDATLHAHAETLVCDIKNQAMLQCVMPYMSLKLDKMAANFEMDPKDMETEVASLISRGMIQARIDSQNRTILAKRDDNRDGTLNSALETSQAFVREGRAALLRMSLLEKIVVYAPDQSKAATKSTPSMLAHLTVKDPAEDGDFDDAMEEE